MFSLSSRRVQWAATPDSHPVHSKTFAIRTVPGNLGAAETPTARTQRSQYVLTCITCSSVLWSAALCIPRPWRRCTDFFFSILSSFPGLGVMEWSARTFSIWLAGVPFSARWQHFECIGSECEQRIEICFPSVFYVTLCSAC